MSLVQRETDVLRIEVHPNGRARCPTILWRLDSGVQVAFDDVNLASAKDREEFLEHIPPDPLPENLRNGARQLLEDAGIVVARLKHSPEERPQAATLCLRDPEPCPGPVDGAELLRSIRHTLQRYVRLPEGGDVTVALWILLAYSLDAFQVSPILAITSPEKRCGKTTLLLVLLHHVPRALPASNLTPAVLFRAVDQWRPTLLIDQADTFLSSREDAGELRGVLNSGHTRATRSCSETFR